jgi:hypothetical protein
MRSQEKKEKMTPNLPTDSGVLRTPKEFAGALTLELTDDEIKEAFALSVSLSKKFSSWPDTPRSHDKIEDEVATRYSDLNVLAKWDRVEKTIDIMGKLPSDDIHKYGYDHEKQTNMVQEANRRNEDYLGQKENTPKRR